MCRVRKLLRVITALVFLLSACPSTSKQSFPDAPNDVSSLTRATCHKKFQCATLKAPSYYSFESFGHFDVAVIRYIDHNQNNRIGSLVLTLGDFGVSDVEYGWGSACADDAVNAYLINVTTTGKTHLYAAITIFSLAQRCASFQHLKRLKRDKFPFF